METAIRTLQEGLPSGKAAPSLPTETVRHRRSGSEVSSKSRGESSVVRSNGGGSKGKGQKYGKAGSATTVGLPDDGLNKVEVGTAGLLTADLSALETEDYCSTCLEPYTDENPKIWTACGHHFHMPCIYEWMERKDTCPICDAKMMFRSD